jgi:cysteine desulfurase family protein
LIHHFYMGPGFMSIYLDNSATSFPKPESVYAAVDQAFRTCGANPGRGGHSMSLDAARLVFSARETIADFFSIADASRLVFTSGATESINTALFGLLNPGDHVVTTAMEHNSLLRPLRILEQSGVLVSIVDADSTGFVSAESIAQACTDATRLVAMSHCSNVTGTVLPVATVAKFCQAKNLLLLVDAAQTAGHTVIDVNELGIDLLAIPGHKGLFAPPGIGCLYVRDGVQLRPLIHGGTGGQSEQDTMPAQMPERLESGTLNTPGIAGLKAGVEFIMDVGLETIIAHEQQIVDSLVQGLRALPGITVYGPADQSHHGGAVSFTCQNRDSSEIGFLLDREYDIMVRVGLHCAPGAHRMIGTFPQGTVRVSPGYFTTLEQIDFFVQAVTNIIHDKSRG